MLRNHRTKRRANLVRIVRADGLEVLVTDHDRTLSFEGRTYVPAVFAGVTAERREVGLEVPTIELHGVIDGSHVAIPDLLGERYTGAEVHHVVTDWQWPWLWVSKSYRTIRGVRWDGIRWVGILDGRTQILERPSGGRFKGRMASTCEYTYGDPDTCKRDLTSETVTGVRVATVNDARIDVEFSTASFPGSFADDYFRDGEIEWLWGAPAFNGTTTAPTTNKRLTQTGAGLTPGAHVGETVRILSGVGADIEAYAEITANDADGVDYLPTPDMVRTSAGATFDIVPDAKNKGHISSIATYVHADRRVTLFAPTPFDILQFESGIARAGCDGLYSTCVSKGNAINFGGQHLQPSPRDQLEALDG